MMACFLAAALSVSGKCRWGDSWVLSKTDGLNMRGEVGLTTVPALEICLSTPFP